MTLYFVFRDFIVNLNVVEKECHLKNAVYQLSTRIVFEI